LRPAPRSDVARGRWTHSAMPRFVGVSAFRLSAHQPVNSPMTSRRRPGTRGFAVVGADDGPPVRPFFRNPALFVGEPTGQTTIRGYGRAPVFGATGFAAFGPGKVWFGHPCCALDVSFLLWLSSLAYSTFCTSNPPSSPVLCGLPLVLYLLSMARLHRASCSSVPYAYIDISLA